MSYFVSRRRLIIHCIVLFSLLTSVSIEVVAQSESLTKEEIHTLINNIADSLEYYYVDVEEAIKLGEDLKRRFLDGEYDSINRAADLARQLTTDLRAFGGDLHLYVSHPDEEMERNDDDESISMNDYGSSTNYGFEEIRFIEGNITYLRISHFSSWTYANATRQKITEIMSLFHDTEAFIIDVKNNPGGVPYVASFFASYFFDKDPVHLADYYVRYQDYGYGIFTEPFVDGKTYPDIPVFILVNNNSASAAEELPFWLQNQNRATIIGDTTAGAGYGARPHELNNNFSISISSSVEVDPVTRKGFQITGVIPDVLAEDSLSFSVALELARKSIGIEKPVDSTKLDKFLSLLETTGNPVNETDIFDQVISLNKEGLLDYNTINNLGYQYINDPDKAVPILRANTILYSFYPNPFDSYGDALTSAGQYKEALLNYEKAVRLAEIKNNPNLNVFISNRDNFLSNYGSLIQKN